MSVKVFPRSEWTSTAPGFPRYSGRKINPLAVTHFRLHYPGDGNHERRHYSKGQSEQALRNYRDFHVRSRGWADIGYPLAGDQSGRAWVAAGTSHAAAHSATPLRKNENFYSLAMLLMIGNNEPLTDALIETINGVWAGLIDGSLGLGKFPNMLTITAHNDVPGASTRCAGPQVDRLLAQGAFRPSAVSASPAPVTPNTSEEDIMQEFLFVSTDAKGRKHHYGTLAPAHYVYVEDEAAYIKGRESFGREVKWWENLAKDRTVGRPREAFGEYIGPEDFRPVNG